LPKTQKPRKRKEQKIREKEAHLNSIYRGESELMKGIESFEGKELSNFLDEKKIKL